MKLLIMDADPDSIKNFKTYLRMSFPVIKTVYTLSSQATDVMVAIKETMPDLILADIRFFGASAQKIIRNIADQYPDIKFILYGTYNDSEYIKRVTEFGVLDYMFRPVKPADFKRCMERAISFYDSYMAQKRAKELIVEKYKKEMPFYRDKFFETLMSGSITRETEIRMCFDYFKFTFDAPYTVFVIRIDSFKKVILTMDETDKHLLSYRINGLVKEQFRTKVLNAHSFITGFNCVTCLLSADIAFEDLLELCDDIKDDIFYTLRIRVTIGVGRTYDTPVQIPVSYREANAALRYRFYVGHNTSIPIHFVEPNNSLTYRYPVALEEKLVHAAVIGEYEYCESLLAQLFSVLKETGYVSGKLLQRLIMGILFSMGRYALEQNISEDIDMTSFFKTRDIIKITNADEAHEYLKKDLKNFCESMIALREAKSSSILAEAKEYIGSFYYENINVSKLSVKLGTTGEFLSKLFMDKEKCTCYEYIVKVRVEESKKLLRVSDNSDEFVALKVGYDDVRHFKGIFKRQTGMSVSEYRALRL